MSKKHYEGKCCKKQFNNECCCNCLHQRELMCHPCNSNIGKGSILKGMGAYACIVIFGDGSNLGTAVFFDKKHGLCELHKDK